jgi:hypothetical protein
VLEPRRLSQVPSPFGAPASASWASCSRRGLPPLLRSAYQARRHWTPTGFPRSTHPRHDREGRPFYPEASGAHTTDSSSPVAACRLFQRRGSITRVFFPSTQAANDEASAGVHSRSPVRSSPCLSLPRTEREPLGFFSELRTSAGRTYQRTSERGRILSTDPELRIRHRRPPIRELTRHARPRVAPSCSAWPPP